MSIFLEENHVLFFFFFAQCPVKFEIKVLNSNISLSFLFYFSRKKHIYQSPRAIQNTLGGVSKMLSYKSHATSVSSTPQVSLSGAV